MRMGSDLLKRGQYFSEGSLGDGQALPTPPFHLSLTMALSTDFASLCASPPMFVFLRADPTAPGRAQGWRLSKDSGHKPGKERLMAAT